MPMTDFKFDGVSFSVEWVKRLTREEFVNHELHDNHYPRLSPEEKRAKLHEVYTLITGQNPVEKIRRRQGK